MNNISIIKYNTLNVGDEIQSLATRRTIESLGHQVNQGIFREKLSEYKGEATKLVCNGWFMENPENWPPAENINPLFISMHISHENGAMHKMLDQKGIDYLQKHGPIGCRDKHTLRLLQSKGVDAYFSGCMTLTLQNQYKGERTNEIVLADPLHQLRPAGYEHKFARKLVPDEYQKDVVYVTHRRPSRDISQEKRVKDAEEMIDLYSRAKVVLTSRIHVALPCLALGTPVAFIDNGFNSEKLKNRFEGLVDNMRTFKIDTLPLNKNSFGQKSMRYAGFYKLASGKDIKPIDINWENPEANPRDVQHIIDGIKNKVSDFLK